MKQYIVTFLVFFIAVSVLNAQPERRKRDKAMKRIEQLEKLQIIERLDLGEEQAIRFFAMKNRFRNERESIMQKINDVLNRAEKAKNDNELTALTDEFERFNKSLSKNREDFVAAVRSMLTPKQQMEFFVFERRFRDDLRDLMKGRGPKPRAD